MPFVRRARKVTKPKNSVAKQERHDDSILSQISQNGTTNVTTMLEDFDKQLENWLALFDNEYLEKVKLIEREYNIARMKIPPAIGNSILVVESKKEPDNSENTKNNVVEDGNNREHTSRKRSATTSPPNVRRVGPMTRSSSVNRQKGAAFPPLSKAGIFKTPAVPGLTSSASTLITPKMVPNTPLNVFRHPQQGELAISLKGSPLLVTSLVHQNRANVNVPLVDGRVLSILPEPGLKPYDLPNLDEVTRNELKTLREHLDTFINM